MPCVGLIPYSVCACNLTQYVLLKLQVFSGAETKKPDLAGEVSPVIKVGKVDVCGVQLCCRGERQDGSIRTEKLGGGMGWMNMFAFVCANIDQVICYMSCMVSSFPLSIIFTTSCC